MGSLADVVEVDVLKMLTGQATSIFTTTPLANGYIALFTAVPSDTGGGTEVTGGSYARVQGVGKWGTPASGSVANSSAVTFPTATVAWGTVTSFAVMSASTAGTLWAWGTLGTSKVVDVGDTPSFAIGALTITLD